MRLQPTGAMQVSSEFALFFPTVALSEALDAIVQAQDSAAGALEILPEVFINSSVCNAGFNNVCLPP